MKKVMVVGSANYDIFMNLEQIPRIGETANASSAACCAGGKGANQAAQIGKLGTPVCFVGCVGDDSMGQVVVESLRKCGVDCGYISKIKNENTGIGVVDVLPGGRVMAAISHGANYRACFADIERLIKQEEDVEMVVLQLEIPVKVVEDTIACAKKYGKTVLLNAAPALELSGKCLAQCDYVVVNEVEAEFYIGNTVDSVEHAEKYLKIMAQKYHNCWICTLGEKGAVVCDEENCWHIEAIKVPVLETTGAGDSFIGGFVHAVLAGKELKQAAEFAAACSSVTIQNVGAQDSMPSYEQLELPR